MFKELHSGLFTSHSDVQLLHDYVVLKIRVSSEVESNPVTRFVVLKRFNLERTPKKMSLLSFCVFLHFQHPDFEIRPTSRSVM